MSGIYGVWRLQNDLKQCEKDINCLKLWNKAYGNAGEDIYMGNDFSMGCYIEKLSENANISAPVIKVRNKYAVIDAVLYNRETLIEKGKFESMLSDEELLFFYTEKFGMSSLKDVNGDFCGAIYDTSANKITLFRDHMGVRPLFYYADENGMAFSTDIRGLVGMQQVDVSADERWIWSKITGIGGLNVENTEFAHIFCVKPATYMTFKAVKNDLQIEKKPYWKLGSRKIRLSSEEEYVKLLRELITDSVKRRLEAVSGFVGAELSGGLDSSVIDILIKRLGRECIYYSWAASPEVLPIAEDDERQIIDDICTQEGIRCNYGGVTMLFNNESIISQKMQQIGIELNMNESTPIMYVLPPYVNTLQISETAQFINRSGAKVVFTGHGGDEGVSHRCNPYEIFYHKEFISYWKYMWSTTEGTKHRIYRTLLRCHKNLFVTRKQLVSPYVGVFAAQDVLQKEFWEKLNNKKEKPSLKFAYDTIAYVNEGGSRNRLDVVALLGAYNGVRYLVPYLDYRVIDYAVSIPRHMYLKHQTRRYIFREAFKDMMPESLYTLDCKKARSWNNYVEEPLKEEVYLERKKKSLERLDRAYWEKYLNWDVLDAWAGQKSDEVDEMRDKAVSMCVSACVQLQNVIKRSKTVE